MSKELEDNEYWRDKLTPEEYRITREKGTERAFSGEYWDTSDMGAYKCRCCGEQLFLSDSKYDSGCGWPSFFKPADGEKIQGDDETQTVGGTYDQAFEV